jgi:hypothetical protein
MSGKAIFDQVYTDLGLSERGETLAAKYVCRRLKQLDPVSLNSGEKLV